MISVIFCGGYGTRMNNGKPGTLKPLIEVAGKAILLHIITIYNKYHYIKKFYIICHIHIPHFLIIYIVIILI